MSKESKGQTCQEGEVPKETPEGENCEGLVEVDYEALAAQKKPRVVYRFARKIDVIVHILKDHEGGERGRSDLSGTMTGDLDWPCLASEMNLPANAIRKIMQKMIESGILKKTRWEIRHDDKPVLSGFMYTGERATGNYPLKWFGVELKKGVTFATFHD